MLLTLVSLPLPVHFFLHEMKRREKKEEEEEKKANPVCLHSHAICRIIWPTNTETPHTQPQSDTWRELSQWFNYQITASSICSVPFLGSRSMATKWEFSKRIGKKWKTNNNRSSLGQLWLSGWNWVPAATPTFDIDIIHILRYINRMSNTHPLTNR